MELRPKASDSVDTKPTTVDRESGQLTQSTAEQEIRDRAYEIYLQRGEQHGSDLDDWLQAERDLSTRSPA
jgi:hypothetical protein